jgi:hypothetical protein
VVTLLSLVIGVFAVMVQGALATQKQVETLQASVRTVIELREAGAFGTGGFGGDKPPGADDFSVATLEQIRGIPNARHIAKIEEYVHTPQIDTGAPNAYAMIIGLPPGAPMRAVGEVDYENARIVAGRGFGPPDDGHHVAVVGSLYAKERLGLSLGGGALTPGKPLTLNGVPIRVVGVYSTGNDFGDNHVFVPIGTFRRIFQPGGKLSKIRVTVNSVANVEAVTEDLRQLKGVDAVAAAEQVATARATLGGIAAAAFYGSLLLFAVGSVLVVFIMVLATRERVGEIGTLKAIGASNAEIAKQFVGEVFALTGSAAAGAPVFAAVFGLALRVTFDVDLRFDRETFLLIALGGIVFALLGVCYPVLTGIRLSPVEAMKST